MSLFTRQVSDASGAPVDGEWEYVRSECRTPPFPESHDPQRPEQRRQLTVGDVRSAIRRLGLPPGTVRAPRYTLVNLETTFFTEPSTIDRTLSIIGYTVDVHIEPHRYTWTWGDGSSTTTDTPGRPYPATDVTHTYAQTSGRGSPYQVSVDVTYVARFRVDGQPWQQIPETLTIPGPARDLPVKQASAVLVTGDD